MRSVCREHRNVSRCFALYVTLCAAGSRCVSLCISFCVFRCMFRSLYFVLCFALCSTESVCPAAYLAAYPTVCPNAHIQLYAIQCMGHCVCVSSAHRVSYDSVSSRLSSRLSCVYIGRCTLPGCCVLKLAIYELNIRGEYTSEERASDD